MTLEIAAVAVAGVNSPGAMARWLMRPSVAGPVVSIGFLFTVLFGLMTLGHSYRAVGILSDQAYLIVRTIGTLLLLASLALGLTFF